MIWEKMLKQPVAAATGYTPNAVKFDGANDYLTRGADLTGIADSKSGIFSCWVRLEGNDAGTNVLLGQGSVSGLLFRVWRNASGYFEIYAYKNDGATVHLQMRTAKTYFASAKWYHILASWDLVGATTTTLHIYINDVSDKYLSAVVDGTIDYTAATPDWGVGANPSNSSKLDGALSELYFAPGQYLDFSVEANRRKFIDSSGLPVSLGSTGATPTGTAPAIYLKGDYSGFGTNSGTGGNFTVNGALEKASTTPATTAVNAVDFDGTSDYLTKPGDLSGLSDGSSGVISFWMRVDGGDGAARYILANPALYFEVQINVSNFLQIVGYTSAGALILSIRTSTAITASPKWRHICASWSLGTTTHIYLDGVGDKVATTATAGTIDYYRNGTWGALADSSGTNKFNGAISELYFAPNQYLDLSVQANREKFILNGAPVSLGATGSLPTGTAPAVYLPNRAALVGTNAGSGGNFTINGAPKDANSTPVYYYAEPVKFDGTNDYMKRGASLTGIADGATGTISFWMRVDASGVTRAIIASTSNYFYLYLNSATNNLKMQVFNTSAQWGIDGSTTATFTASPVWRHVVISWNLATSTLQCYVDNALDSGLSTVLYTANADYTVADWGIGGFSSGTFNGAIADLWFNTTYLDLSNSANRAKFIDQTTLRPVALGAKGELPTGSQPLLYLGRDFSNFQTNLGSGGNFTVTGALERGTTSPSDVKA